MASDDHKRLANIIKDVHQTLRIESRTYGEEGAWEKHCQREDTLKVYAAAMQQLATQFWEKNADDSTNCKAISRVKWVVNKCISYFFSGGDKLALEKEISLCNKYKLEHNIYRRVTSEMKEKLRVLDVGSCYNPFKDISQFSVTAVDIAPASSDVLLCDFLKVDIVDDIHTPIPLKGKISELPASCFSIVIFSLLLEYLPSAKQRYICCLKASRLLTQGGILCIVTPDSKHATANSQIMRSWRYALANLGLLRIEYEKLPHIHCMVYRKCFNVDVPQQWLLSCEAIDMVKGRHQAGPPEDLMMIPQDFHSYEKTEQVTGNHIRGDNESVASMFEDLPQVDPSELND